MSLVGDNILRAKSASEPTGDGLDRVTGMQYEYSTSNTLSALP